MREVAQIIEVKVHGTMTHNFFRFVTSSLPQTLTLSHLGTKFPVTMRAFLELILDFGRLLLPGRARRQGSNRVALHTLILDVEHLARLLGLHLRGRIILGNLLTLPGT